MGGYAKNIDQREQMDNEACTEMYKELVIV